ncbi:anhydro-N-acetylmuramic acid kinase [Mangrovibacterium diazotrophicum]|uniref:Anhydro-N-acetylmuramic acid kinase n=1 Tax=Mangrovibacterium diazotrophicum TaxID=1261403 RepID=A0A419W9U0_9BACT|nr:anhydro-N-acetylmuramic acid kinase [Mangrovibacterium diazotrophicum]RKD92209.1 anhydro-N-acetylmuramic acid kinase [Mangrovibacterium diazotrophicum]
MSKLYIGIMSGTSMDGIDAVLISFENGKLSHLADHTMAFPEALQADLHKLIGSFQTSLKDLGEIDHRLALCYAQAANELIEKAKVAATDIEAIGCHGQTVFHSPDTQHPFTMQLGDGNLIAARTGIKIITDFRRMDMAVGGGGAPLAPAFHQYFLNDHSENRCILNLGGIANITILDNDDNKVVGFDTGPANCLMNSWIKMKKGVEYDDNGDWARSGKVIQPLLDKMLKEPYFSLPAPKSTGRELFNLDWLNTQIKDLQHYKDGDIQATLLELTAKSIADAILVTAPQTSAVYACGGGVYNPYLLERISANLDGVKIGTTAELGTHPQWVEAIAFAWLAMRRMTNQHGNLPSVTGAKSKVLLGTIYDPATF